MRKHARSISLAFQNPDGFVISTTASRGLYIEWRTVWGAEECDPVLSFTPSSIFVWYSNVVVENRPVAGVVCNVTAFLFFALELVLLSALQRQMSLLVGRRILFKFDAESLWNL